MERWVSCGGCGEVGEVWRRWVGLAGPLPADSGEGKLSRPPSHLASYIPQHLGGFPKIFFNKFSVLGKVKTMY